MRTTRRPAGAVARDGHEVDVDGDGDGARQVGEEDERPLSTETRTGVRPA